MAMPSARGPTPVSGAADLFGREIGVAELPSVRGGDRLRRSRGGQSEGLGPEAVRRGRHAGMWSCAPSAVRSARGPTDGGGRGVGGTVRELESRAGALGA